MEGTVASFAVAAVAAAAPTVVYVLILWWLDRYEKEPVWLLTLAFLWGALPGILVALLLEFAWRWSLGAMGNGSGSLIEAGGIAPLVEEGVKGLGLLAIFQLYRAEFDDALDGIIYGGIVGLGFALTENALYLGNGLLHGGLASFGLLWVLRVVVFGLNHALFTAATGVGLGLARLARGGWQKWLAPGLGFATAVALHATHNLFAALANITCWSLLASLLSDWGGLAVLLVAIILSWRQELGWLRSELASEVELGVISAQEYAALVSRARRLGGYWTTVVGQGWAAACDRRRRAAWATELAFKKHQLAAAGPQAGDPAAIERLRARLRG